MYRIISIILASTCMIHSRNLYEYSFTFPVRDNPGEYEYSYRVKPYPKNFYPKSNTRTDEVIKQNLLALEKTLASKSVSANTSSAQKSLELFNEKEWTTTSTPRNYILNSKSWSDSSSDEKTTSKPALKNTPDTYKATPQYSQSSSSESDILPKSYPVPIVKYSLNQPQYTDNYKHTYDTPVHQVDKTIAPKDKEPPSSKIPEKLNAKYNKYSAKKSTNRPKLSKKSISDKASPQNYKTRPKYPKKYEKLNTSDWSPEHRFRSNEESSSYKKDMQYLNRHDDDYSEEEPLMPAYLTTYYPENVSIDTWLAPPFYQSLQDFDETWSAVEYHLLRKNGKSKFYGNHASIIAGALDGMIKTMTHSHWHYYEREYKKKMPKLIKYARIARYIVNSQVQCVYEWINHSIKEIRAVMNNYLLSHICKTTKVPCDTLLLGVVDSSKNKLLQEQARILLALGKASKMYLDNYLQTLDRQATYSMSTVNEFLLNSSTYFRPLIKVASDVRKLLPSSYKCHDAPLTPDSDE